MFRTKRLQVAVAVLGISGLALAQGYQARKAAAALLTVLGPLYLNSEHTSSIQGVSGDIVIDSASQIVRTPEGFNVGGATKLGNASMDYLEVAGGSAGAGTTITSRSSGSNSGVTITPKGTGGLTLTTGTLTLSSGGVTASGAVAGGSLTVASLKAPVVHGAGTAQQAIERGTVSLGGDATETVTFDTAFAARPFCVCSTTNGGTDACTTNTPDVNGVVLNGGSFGDVDWICIGQR